MEFWKELLYDKGGNGGTKEIPREICPPISIFLMALWDFIGLCQSANCCRSSSVVNWKAPVVCRAGYPVASSPGLHHVACIL